MPKWGAQTQKPWAKVKLCKKICPYIFLRKLFARPLCKNIKKVVPTMARSCSNKNNCRKPLLKSLRSSNVNYHFGIPLVVQLLYWSERGSMGRELEDLLKFHNKYIYGELKLMFECWSSIRTKMQLAWNKSFSMQEHV